MRLYTFHASVKGYTNSTLDEACKDIKKRNSILTGDTIESLDRLTSKFSSLEDLQEEFNNIYEKKLELYDSVIIADPNEEDLEKSYIIKDIVYDEDLKVLENKDYIRKLTIEHLQKNKDDISYFNGIKTIYKNKHQDELISDSLIENIVYAFFNDNQYKKYRDTYFTLKDLGAIKNNKNEIHR